MAESVQENLEFEKRCLEKENVLSSAGVAIAQGSSESTQFTKEPLLYVQPWLRPSLKDFSELVDVYKRRPLSNNSMNKVASEYQIIHEDKKPQFKKGPSEIYEIPEMSVIQKHMRCSLCPAIPSPEALMCTNGHLICISCSYVMPCCPFELKNENSKVVTTYPHSGMLNDRETFEKYLCGKSFTNARNQLYTHVYHNSIFKCENAGCEQKSFGAKFWSHAAQCKYVKTVKCQHRQDCGSKTVLMDIYPKHLQKIHKIDLIKCSLQSCLAEYIPKQGGMVIKKLFYVHKEYFGLVFEELDDFLYIWIAHMKNVVDIQKEFCSQVDISCQIPQMLEQRTDGNKITNQHSSVASYFGDVYAFGERDKVLSGHNCVVLPLKSVRRILIKDLGKDNLIVKVFIKPAKNSMETFTWKPVVCDSEVLYWQKEMGKALENFELTHFLKDKIKLKKNEQNNESVSPKEIQTEAFLAFDDIFKSTWGTLFLQYGNDKTVKPKPLPIKPGLEKYTMEHDFHFETSLKQKKPVKSAIHELLTNF